MSVVCCSEPYCKSIIYSFCDYINSGVLYSYHVKPNTFFLASRPWYHKPREKDDGEPSTSRYGEF